MDPGLLRATIDPLASWLPPIISTGFMLLFAAAWYRGAQRAADARLAAEDQRYAALVGAVGKLTEGLADIRLALTGYMTIERHSSSVAKIHDRLEEHARDIAVIRDRCDRD